jgi:hypothetical protein
MPIKERLERLMKKGSGPYLVIFREDIHPYSVMFVDNLIDYWNDIQFLLPDEYEMIVYEASYKPIPKVKPISKVKAEEVWMLTVYGCVEETGYPLIKDYKEGALIIKMDTEEEQFGQEAFKQYKDVVGKEPDW